MRYFFDAENGTRTQDKIGTEYASDAAAEQEARLRALNHQNSHQLKPYNGHATMTVRDLTGRIVCKVPIEH